MRGVVLLAHVQQRAHVLRTNAAGTPPSGSSYGIAWSPDAFFADGTAIGSAVLGFKAYGSQTHGDLNPSLLANVVDPASVGTTINGLASGDWYFSVTAYTTNAESSPVYYEKVTIA